MDSDLDSNADENDDYRTAPIWIANAISIRIVPGTIVLSLHEPWLPALDKEMQARARDQLAALSTDQSWNAVVDLQGKPVVTSSVLGIMVMVRNYVRAAGGNMAVCNVSDMVQEKMQRLNLASLWLILGSLDEALKAVNDTQ